MTVLRSYLKTPGFTAIAVLTLALGLGANTAIFSAIYAILLQQLPFAESERLVSVRAIVKRDTWERRDFSSPDCRDFRALATKSFSGFAGMDGANFTLSSEGEAVRARAERVSAGYFEVLGASPVLGRAFVATDDDAPDKAPLVVLSDDFWRQRLGAARDVLGQTIKLSDVDHTIIGVMPAGFHGLDDSTQMWVPMTTIGASGLALAEKFPQTNANYSADAAPRRDMALGARAADILLLVLTGTGRLVAIGLIAGAALAAAFTRFIQSLLFNVNAHDPLLYGGVTVLLALVAFVAAWLPARRAARVDPMTALRTE